LSADKIAAENKEEIDPYPAKAIDASGCFKSEERGVIDRDYNDGQRPKKIEAWLPLAIGETRIDFGRLRSAIGGQKWEMASGKNPAAEIPRRLRQRGKGCS
jgi:hypothetical protein